MKKPVYADNAATTQLDIEAFEAMKPWLLEEYGNASQPYAFSRKPKAALKWAREVIAGCINAEPEEIFFTSGGTESDNWAIKGLLFSNEEHNPIVTSAFEHHAVLNTCKTAEHLGFPVIYIKPDPSGRIPLQDLEKSLEEKPFLVSIMLANNELGTIQPIKELCFAAHEKKALFHTDAVQAVGHIDIDVKDLGVDLLSASAHKFNGPKGIGFLYVKKGLKLWHLLDGGSQEKNMRAGTENIAAIVGMAAALKKNVYSLLENQHHIKDLEESFLEQLSKEEIVYIRNGKEPFLPGLISLSFSGKDSEAILHRMDLMGICVSAGSACNSQNTEISHVLQAIQLPEKLAKGTVRFSFGKYNSLEDIQKVVEALKKIIK